MAEKLGVERLQKNYDGDMQGLELKHVDATKFVDNRYANKRSETRGEGYNALKVAGGHVKQAGSYLWEGAEVLADGVVDIMKGAIEVVGGPLVGTLAAGYEVVLEGGYHTLKSAAIVGKGEATTRVKASGEKRALGKKLKNDKVRATLAYAAAAQAEIDTMNGELVPFEKQVAALKEEIKKIEAATGEITGDKFNMVVERDNFIETAAKLKRPWYRKVL